jgi:purine-binding chemotaxis protein CheW
MRTNGQNGKPGISWERARARLDSAEQIMREVERPSPARARALLETRARQLARPLAPAVLPGELLELVVFSLARERYALETRVVREIVRFSDFTPVPGAPDFLVGVTNLRGAILAVFDLRRFFDLPPKGLTDQSRVLVLGLGSGEGQDRRNDLGVLADETHEVLGLRADEVLEPAATAPSIGRAYVRGVSRDAVVVLDGEKLLRDPRLVIDMDPSEAPGRPERPR